MARWWPPFRQFTQFPLRTLELFMRGWPEGDFGTAGRMIAAGGAVYGAGRMAGLNLSHGLLWGALPAPYGEDQPWYPLPVAPPLFQMGGAVLSDMFGGKFEQVPRSLPLLIPGGVALARVSTVLSPGVAKFLGRSYADYENQRSDGTIPLYSADGGLKGFKTPLQLFGDAVGWKTLTGDPEAELTRFLLAQRDQLRNERRQYIEAIAVNDMNKAQKIQAQHARIYPQLGPIAIKKSDIRAVHLRHDIGRLERILETLPADERAMYGQMVSMGLTEAAPSFLGVDPALLGRPGATIKSRDPYRRQAQSRQTLAISQAAAQQRAGESPITASALPVAAASQGPFTPLTPFEPY
jgi:hypothetical protein